LPGAGHFDEFEIDLFFEGIDARDLDGEIVAEADDAAGSASDELASPAIEFVEVIRDAGEVHEAAHGEFGHINEETEVADIGYEGGVRDRLAGVQLSAQKGKQLDVFAVAFGVGGVAFGDGEMAGGFGQGLGQSRLGIEE
jgi:hypothetical protein